MSHLLRIDYPCHDARRPLPPRPPWRQASTWEAAFPPQRVAGPLDAGMAMEDNLRRFLRRRSQQPWLGRSTCYASSIDCGSRSRRCARLGNGSSSPRMPTAAASSVIFMMAYISCSSRSRSISSSSDRRWTPIPTAARRLLEEHGSRRPAGARRDGAACAAHLSADARGGRPGRAAALGSSGLPASLPPSRSPPARSYPPGVEMTVYLSWLATLARAGPDNTGDDQRPRGAGRSRLRGHRDCRRLGCVTSTGCGTESRPSVAS